MIQRLFHVIPAQLGDVPVPRDDSAMWFRLFEWAILLWVVIGGGIYFWRRSKRMQAILEAPETSEEKAARLQIPPRLKEASSTDLVAGLKEDLRNADAYLESAQHALKSSINLSALDLVGYEGDAGGGGPKQEAMNSLFNDLMHADKFLIECRHRLRILGERDDLEFPLPVGGHETVTFDWVADNPLADFITYRRLKKLKPRVEGLRKAVQELSTKLGGRAARAG